MFRYVLIKKLIHLCLTLLFYEVTQVSLNVRYYYFYILCDCFYIIIIFCLYCDVIIIFRLLMYGYKTGCVNFHCVSLKRKFIFTSTYNFFSLRLEKNC